MNKLIAMLLAAVFAGVSFNAIAQDKKPTADKPKPTAEECKKDPKMAGCEKRRSKLRSDTEGRTRVLPFSRPPSMSSLTDRARLAIAATALALPFVTGAQLPPLPLRAGIHLIQAEVANTAASRERGLMHREKLAPNQGMLFVFPETSVHCMWMRNTLVPLSVAFLDERGVILNIANMQPQTEVSHCAGSPARYALEMNVGWFAAKGVKPGAKISGLDKAPSPQ